MKLSGDQHKDNFPNPENSNEKINSVYCAIVGLNNVITDFINLTDVLPKFLPRGNEHMLLGCYYDNNYVRGVSIKNRKVHIISKTQKSIHQLLSAACIVPRTYVLDNERSKDLLDSFISNNVKYQLVLSYKHRANQEERTMQIFKYRFKEALAGLDPKFPLLQWHILAPQENLTLNLLRSSQANLKLFSCACMFGYFSFNATPIAPSGTK